MEMTLDDVDGIAKGHFLRWADQTIGPARSVPMIRPAFRNDGLLRQFFFYACVFRTDAGKKKRAISAEMPQHDYHITEEYGKSIKICVWELLSPFCMILAGKSCETSHLEKREKLGYYIDTKR